MKISKIINKLVGLIKIDGDYDVDNLLIMNDEVVELKYFIGIDIKNTDVSCLPSNNSEKISKDFLKSINFSKSK